MLSCRDLYRISLQLTKIYGAPELPFGGVNMIFAGDFAQLPPVFGGEGSALYSLSAGSSSGKYVSQIAATGKALWHQVLTVVILRKNMRQTGLSLIDVQFRNALNNMRYKSCTKEDIKMLKTRVHSNLPNRPRVTDKEFRDVSVITSFNICKDAFNELGSIRFGEETKQTLMTFYSEDTFSEDNNGQLNSKKRKRAKHNTGLPDNLQDVVWNLPDSSNTKNIPGKLNLCLGLPVMIRNNLATELCITKGQEGTVYGWNYRLGKKGMKVLETLFVELSNAPFSVQFDNLPVNVVPVYKTTTATICTLPNDRKVSISRTQVEVIPNFAMTDYASQGKTRPWNVVHLNDCRTHQSIYTALSRGTCAKGTLIIQGFEDKLVTGGCSGPLRQ
ncbi:hypothetical protein BDN72DRAFT_771311, partial [Pluteus cervinus]